MITGGAPKELKDKSASRYTEKGAGSTSLAGSPLLKSVQLPSTGKDALQKAIVLKEPDVLSMKQGSSSTASG
jgi:hypothetical protein